MALKGEAAIQIGLELNQDILKENLGLMLSLKQEKTATDYLSMNLSINFK